jgi:glycosyltransferase involved in cell wall biosynthesis
MAKIGIFGLNLSPKSGGVYSLARGLVRHAQYSRNELVYLTGYSEPASELPANVQLIVRPRIITPICQAFLKLPVALNLLRRRNLAGRALAMAAGSVGKRVLSNLDALIWPHSFVPLPNLPHMVTICHDMIHVHHPEYFGRRAVARRVQAERSLEWASLILCPSRTTADDLLTAYPTLRDRTRTFAEAPSGIDAKDDCEVEREQVRANYGSVPIFLFVGVDWPHKNHRLLIEAALALRARTSQSFKLLFVGHRRTNILRDEIARRHASACVYDLGPVSTKMLSALFREATAFLFPSLCEGFGIPLVEAMQFGTPIVASNCSCIPEICGECAVLLSPLAAMDWAVEMERLMTDSAHRDDLSARAAARAKQFTWQRTWREIDAALSETLGFTT